MLQRGYHKDVKNSDANQAASQVITDDTGVATDGLTQPHLYTSWQTHYNAACTQAVRNEWFTIWQVS